MNQILSVDNNPGPKKRQKNKKIAKEPRMPREPSGPVEISKILRVFAITMLIFGIFMIGTGSYSMYTESKKNVKPTKPTLNVQEISETEISVGVTHDKALQKIVYHWNEDAEIEINCEGKKTTQETIQIPTGTNILYLSAIDVNGERIDYQREYTLQGDIMINFELDGNNIKITGEGKSNLAYMTYRWDDGEETRIDVNTVRFEEFTEIPKGLHTLTVIVVDENNKTEEKSQEVKGVTKPKLEVGTDGASKFIIRASDEVGLSRVEFLINEGDEDEEKNAITLDGQTEFEFEYEFHQGENRLEVRVYNVDDVVEINRSKVTIE